VTPLRFEAQYADEWLELETLLDRLLGRSKASKSDPAIRGERVAALYRRACEHLALARARAYPPYLLDRLERLTADAHQVIYQRRDLGAAALWRLVSVDFPRAVRRDGRYVALSALLLALPMVVLGTLVFLRPELVLSVVDANAAATYQQMYSDAAESIGRFRDASGDWVMFGFYISHNIGISFQCFAGGLFAGVGSIFFLLYNGASIGAVAGFLTQRGLGATFWSFVATHSAFELTAIVLSGAAGLRLGHALVAPGRRTRRQSLVQAAKECAVIVYGLAAMLLIAAAIEAFWSSARWLPSFVKYSVAAVCWIGVLCYFVFQGRRAD
jgi:uncharacterized membrane protein SpoIIM required for sporulation